MHAMNTRNTRNTHRSIVTVFLVASCLAGACDSKTPPRQPTQPATNSPSATPPTPMGKPAPAAPTTPMTPTTPTTPAAPARAAIEDITWRLKEIDGKPALPSQGPRPVGITFVSKDRTFAANASINNLGGGYTLDGTTLKIKPGPMTMMAGPEPLMNQEQQFIAALGRVTTFRVADSTMSLLVGDQVVLVFERGG